MQTPGPTLTILEMWAPIPCATRGHKVSVRRVAGLLCVAASVSKSPGQSSMNNFRLMLQQVHQYKMPISLVAFPAHANPRAHTHDPGDVGPYSMRHKGPQGLRAPCCRVALRGSFCVKIAGTEQHEQFQADAAARKSVENADILSGLSCACKPPGPHSRSWRCGPLFHAPQGATRSPCAVLQGCFAWQLLCQNRRDRAT